MGDAVFARAIAVALCVATVLAGLVIVPTAVRADLPLDSLAVGSRWSYAFSQANGNLSSSGTGTYILTDVGVANVTVGGVLYPCDHLKINFNATYTSGTLVSSVVITGDAYYRRSDLALVEETLRFPFGGSTLTETVDYTPPMALRWPLVPGATWTSSTVQTVTSSSSGSTSTSSSNLSADYHVGATVSRAVPAGTFVTTPLNATYTDGSSSAQYWSAVAGFWVEQDNVANGSHSSLRLSSYHLPMPVASFVWSPTTGSAGTTFTFTSTSTDPWDASTALQVRWDWQTDGTWDTAWSSNGTVSHVFTAPGVYNVTLEVLDTRGFTANRTERITVTVAPSPLDIPVLGAPLYVWLVVATAVAVGSVLVLLLRRRKTKPAPPPPPPPVD